MKCIFEDSRKSKDSEDDKQLSDKLSLLFI